MNLSRLIPFTVLLAAPVCMAQLPPSILQPGRPAVPVPAVPAAPDLPATPTSAATGAPAPLSNGLPNTLTADDVAQGWKLLFDGKRILGMKGLQRTDPLSSGWKIQDGELWLPKDIKDMQRMTGGDLVTMDFFWDFDFRFEWKMTTGADSGVRYMLTEAMGQVPVGLEYQILDDVHSGVKLKADTTRRSGALDGIYPPGENARVRQADPLNKSGDPWQEGRIVVQGTHVEHWLNGEKVLEFELGPKIRQIAAAKKMRVPATFGNKTRTRLSILDQGYEVSFRNLKVLTLAPQAVVIPNSSAPNPLLIPRGPR